MQSLLALCLLALAFVDIDQELNAFAMLIILLSLAASIADVATDGYATLTLTSEERSFGNTAQVASFYLGNIIGGGFFLVIESSAGAAQAFLMIAAIVMLGLTAVFSLKTVQTAEQSSQNANYLNFFKRPNILSFVEGILFLVIFQNIGMNFNGVFLLDSGITKQQLGTVTLYNGSIAAIFGSILGGLIFRRIDLVVGLVVFALLQATTLIGFAALAASGSVTISLATIATIIQALTTSCFNVALYTAFMRWASKEQAATDFAILGCVHFATFLIASPVAGWSTAHLGYTIHYTLSAVCAYAALPIAYLLLRRGAGTGWR